MIKKHLLGIIILLVILLGLLSLSAYAQEQCIIVKLLIIQGVTLERDAFDAKLTLKNELTENDLTNIKINIEFKDSEGNIVNDLFFVKPTYVGYQNKKHRQIFLGRDIAEDRNCGEEVAGAIDKEVKEIVEKCYQTAQHLLEENKGILAHLAKLLMEKETLEGEELKKVLDEVVGERAEVRSQKSEVRCQGVKESISNQL